MGDREARMGRESGQVLTSEGRLSSGAEAQRHWPSSRARLTLILPRAEGRRVCAMRDGHQERSQW